MWRWTLKSLLSEPMALMGSIAAVASAMFLVILFEAVYAGESDQVVAFIDHADADVWVMQRGVSNMHMATSYLSDWKVEQIREVPGVEDVDAILYLNTVIEAGGRQWFSYVVGMNVTGTLAGPWAMAEGQARPGPGEAVVPDVFTRDSDLKPGDSIRIADHPFTIVGLSKETFSMANSIIFVSRNDLEDIMSAFDIVSFVLVKAGPGIVSERLAADIEQAVDGVQALPTEQFVLNDRRMAMQMGVETIALMTVIGGLLAMLLVAFTLYSQVSRQRRELAVAKALGATNTALYISVALQAMGITLVSVVLASGLAWVMVPTASTFIPQVTLHLTVSSVVRTALVGGAVAILACLAPAHQIAQVDPLTAFQG